MKDRRARLFYVHASEDDVHRRALEAHVSSLEQEGIVRGWHAGLLQAGSEADREIAGELTRADVVVLLLSADFMASKSCQSLLEQVQREHASRALPVVPVIARPVDWHGTFFEHMQALPRNGRAVTSWPNQDEAWLDVAQGLRRLLIDGSTAGSAAGVRGADEPALTGQETPPVPGADLSTAARTARVQPQRDGLYRRVDELIEADQLDEADRALSRSRSSRQGSADLWYWRSRVAFGRSNTEVAIAYVNEALKRNDRHSYSLVLKIKLLLLGTRPGDRSEAAELARRSRGIDDALDAWLDCMDAEGLLGSGACSSSEIEARCPAPAHRWAKECSGV